MTKSLIGITPEAITLTRPDGRGAFCGVSYSQAIIMAGGIPVTLPLTNDTAVLEELLSRCDGVLLAGGGDAAEETGTYGRKLTPEERKSLSGVDAVRDEMEIFLIRQLIEQDKPVLGICRGIQMMNVALGGTLLPDVAGHREPHRIEWVRGRQLVRCERVNSSHHQALGQIAPALEVLARAADGIIEAAQVTGMRFGVGVQFHPERLVGTEPELLRIFSAFVAATRR